ncbi:MAG: pyridoxal-phosphate dependent enzyme, partial [Candidatus Woesearchaeota archaeon]
MIYENITELIGNTPLLKISSDVHKLEHITLYVKLEMYNPFGSVKDRIAYNMVKDSLAEIKEQKKTIIESSSGNTAKALATLSCMNNIPFTVITNRIKTQSVRE